MQGNQDPRAQRSRSRMLDAVRHILLNEGAEAVTHQRVADVARVGRATVYRHWQSSDEMIYALLDDDPFRLLRDDIEGSLQHRLSTWMLWVGELLANPQRRTVILHILSRTEADARAARLRQQRVAELVMHLDAVLSSNDEWRLQTMEQKIDAVTMLMGSVMMRALFMGQPSSPEFVSDVVQRFLIWLENRGSTSQCR